MLLVPYCKISLTRIRIKPLHLFLILIQIIGGLGIYTALSFYDPLVAQGIFICVLAPTATSAAVITGMLGGNVASLATFSLLSNLCVAVLSPLDILVYRRTRFDAVRTLLRDHLPSDDPLY